MLDRVPTPWLITSGAGAVLAITAAFGGVHPVPVPPTPELTVGDSFTGSDLTMTVVARASSGSGAIAPSSTSPSRSTRNIATMPRLHARGYTQMLGAGFLVGGRADAVAQSCTQSSICGTPPGRPTAANSSSWRTVPPERRSMRARTITFA